MLLPFFWVFLGLTGYHYSLPLVVRKGSAVPIAIGEGRSSIWSPDRKIRAIESRVWDFFPFSFAWKIPSFEDVRRKRQAFRMIEEKVMGGNAWWRGWVA